MASNPGEWLGLLKWSLAYSDGTGQTTAKEMTSERRAWLEEAMSELVVDEAKRMKEIVEQLTVINAQAGDEAEATALFEELEDIVDNLDAAWDLIKMGSMDAVIEMLRSEHAYIRIGAAQIVATCAQNNPKCQAALLQLGALAYTTHMTMHDSSAGVRLKALSAVSSLIRNCKDGERDFVEQGDGLLVLARGLASTEHRFVAKCVHLLSFLLTEDPMLREADALTKHQQILVAAHATEAAGCLIGHDDVNVRLGCLELLGKLGELGDVRAKLESRFKELESLGAPGEDLDENQDEIDALQTILG